MKVDPERHVNNSTQNIWKVILQVLQSIDWALGIENWINKPNTAKRNAAREGSIGSERRPGGGGPSWCRWPRWAAWPSTRPTRCTGGGRPSVASTPAGCIGSWSSWSPARLWTCGRASAACGRCAGRCRTWWSAAPSVPVRTEGKSWLTAGTATSPTIAPVSPTTKTESVQIDFF